MGYAKTAVLCALAISALATGAQALQAGIGGGNLGSNGGNNNPLTLAEFLASLHNGFPLRRSQTAEGVIWAGGRIADDTGLISFIIFLEWGSLNLVYHYDAAGALTFSLGLENLVVSEEIDPLSGSGEIERLTFHIQNCGSAVTVFLTAVGPNAEILVVPNSEEPVPVASSASGSEGTPGSAPAGVSVQPISPPGVGATGPPLSSNYVPPGSLIELPVTDDSQTRGGNNNQKNKGASPAGGPPLAEERPFSRGRANAHPVNSIPALAFAEPAAAPSQNRAPLPRIDAPDPSPDAAFESSAWTDGAEFPAASFGQPARPAPGEEAFSAEPANFSEQRIPLAKPALAAASASARRENVKEKRESRTARAFSKKSNPSLQEKSPRRSDDGSPFFFGIEALAFLACTVLSFLLIQTKYLPQRRYARPYNPFPCAR